MTESRKNSRFEMHPPANVNAPSSPDIELMGRALPPPPQRRSRRSWWLVAAVVLVFGALAVNRGLLNGITDSSSAPPASSAD